MMMTVRMAQWPPNLEPAAVLLLSLVHVVDVPVQLRYLERQKPSPGPCSF